MVIAVQERKPAHSRPANPQCHRTYPTTLATCTKVAMRLDYNPPFVS